MTTKTTLPVDISRLPKPILSQHPEWIDLYDFAWKLAVKSLRQSPKRTYMDIGIGLDGNVEWVWDTCFVALFARYGAGMFPGIQGLDNFYDLQREDGYISMTYNMDDGEERFPDRINPPLFAWVEWEYFRATGDDSRLARVTPHIEKHMEWIDANRRNEPHLRREAMAKKVPDDERETLSTYRLYYFTDCGSSGMDDSPRTPRRPGAGQYYDWIDLSSQMALSFHYLARIRHHLGQRERAEAWRQRADELGALINDELWSERNGFYHDRLIPTSLVGHKTAAGFWPILAGICPPERRRRLVRHLFDPHSFGAPVPVPTLSTDDINYSADGRYWKGGVWAPINYMVTRGLMLHDQGDDAHQVAMRYLDAMSRTYRNYSPATLWECYSPEFDRPGIRANSANIVRPDFVGWSAIGPIAMLIENILGLDLDLIEGTLTWDIRLTEEHGIEDLALGDKARLSVLCRERRTPSEPARVRIRSDRDLKIVLRRNDTVKHRTIAPGADTELEV